MMLFKLYLMFLFVLITIVFKSQSRTIRYDDEYDYDDSNEKDCSLPKASGDSNCNAFSQKFYFDTDQKCKKFVYSGCGGNSNRFLSKTSCIKVCNVKTLTKRQKKKLYPHKKHKTPRPYKFRHIEDKLLKKH